MLNIHIPEEEHDLRPRITVVGVGGAGCNGVNNMISSGLQGVEFLVCNSDAQSLKMNQADRKIQLGLNVTRGLGAGARPDVGRAAADEALDEIMGYLEGSNMVFITAGMGGGTGTGAAPVIARAAKEAGILTVGVVTKPFHFEGAHRMRLADAGIEELQQHVDTLLIIPNQNLFRVANEKTTFADAFKLADEVLHAGVRGVTDLMVMPGLINLDFADIRAVMSEMGKAMMGTGEASGDRRAVDAAEAAINNPLLEDASMQGAKGLLINITGGMDMTLYEVDEACNRIRDEVDPDANIIFGSTFDPSLDGKIRVSVVATGIDGGLQAYKSTGGFGHSLNSNPHGGNPQGNPMGHLNASQHDGSSPLAAQFAAQSNAQTKPSGFGGQTPFGRGVTLRQGSGTTNATAGNAVSNTQTPMSKTGTGTPVARAPRAHVQNQALIASNPGFYGRASTAAARRIEEEPMTIGTLEEQTAEEAFDNTYAPQAHVQPQAYVHEEMEMAPRHVPNHVQAPQQQQAYQPQQRAKAQPVQQRGEYDGDSFIPPMPMMTETKPVSSPSVSSGMSSSPAASRHNDDLFVEATPAPMAAQHEAPAAPAKRPGLFDRLTGAARQQPQTPTAQPQQPTLTVDNSDHLPPTGGFDDDLDIPAFLRRQAS